MKNMKILAISSVLLLILTSCSDKKGGNTENQKPGYTYPTITETFVDDGTLSVDFTSDPTLKNLFKSYPGADAKEADLLLWRSQVIDAIDTNDIVANKVTYSLIDYHQRNHEDGELSVDDHDIKTSYQITRNKETYSKQGELSLYKKTNSIKQVPGEGSQTKDVVVEDEILDVKGTYTYQTDMVNKKVVEKIDYTDESKKDWVQQIENVDSTVLRKGMVLADLTSFKTGYKKLIDSYKEDSSTNVWTINSTSGITKENENTIFVEFSIIKNTKASSLEPDKDLYREVETFSVRIDKEGFIKEAEHFYSYDWTNPPVGKQSLLQKFDQKYLFEL